MTHAEVYQWQATVQERLGLGYWQALVLAGMSLAVIEGRDCTLSTIAERLGVLGKADSVERRIQRWVANPRLEVAACQVAWVKWVLDSVGVSSGGEMTVLVDETKLGDHLSIMMVGLAYEHRCLPLVWRAYPPKAWPEGQVSLIINLLKRLKSALPAGVSVTVQADRGIGTSPTLVKGVVALNWHYVFRIQGSTHFQNAQTPDSQVQSLIRRGEKPVTLSGQVFKDAGWLDTHLRLIWAQAYDEPWCLISDVQATTGYEYAQRNWQEQGFRDLKSGGWRWNHSQVWQGDHAERLLLVLALAYLLTLSVGWRTVTDPDLLPSITRGHRQRWSLFRLGLRLWAALRRLAQPIRCFLDLRQPITEFSPIGSFF